MGEYLIRKVTNEQKSLLVSDAFGLGYSEGYSDCENEIANKEENLKPSDNKLESEIANQINKIRHRDPDAVYTRDDVVNILEQLSNIQ